MEYTLSSHLTSAYNKYPESEHRPVIGLTTNYTDGDATLRDKYYEQIVAAGGTPVLIPPIADTDVIVNTLEHLDGLLLTGGADYNPLWCGEEPSEKLHGINAHRDLPEMLVTQLAFNRQIPMLGICRGIQTLAMTLGGRVSQDIAEERNRGQIRLRGSGSSAQRQQGTGGSDTAPAHQAFARCRPHRAHPQRALAARQHTLCALSHRKNLRKLLPSSGRGRPRLTLQSDGTVARRCRRGHREP